jgi:hypothetical protein
MADVTLTITLADIKAEALAMLIASLARSSSRTLINIGPPFGMPMGDRTLA